MQLFQQIDLRCDVTTYAAMFCTVEKETFAWVIRPVFTHSASYYKKIYGKITINRDSHWKQEWSLTPADILLGI